MHVQHSSCSSLLQGKYLRCLGRQVMVTPDLGAKHNAGLHRHKSREFSPEVHMTHPPLSLQSTSTVRKFHCSRLVLDLFSGCAYENIWLVYLQPAPLITFQMQPVEQKHVVEPAHEGRVNSI